MRRRARTVYVSVVILLERRATVDASHEHCFRALECCHAEYKRWRVIEPRGRAVKWKPRGGTRAIVSKEGVTDAGDGCRCQLVRRVDPVFVISNSVSLEVNNVRRN